MTLSSPEGTKPLAVTVQRACELSGFGPTSIWAFLRDGRLESVRVAGVRRTLVSYQSLARLLAAWAALSDSAPTGPRRGRPKKNFKPDLSRTGSASEKL
jgi:hypothetical protein